MLSTAKNLKLAKDAIGMEDFEIPEADAYDKQLGEMDILKATGPNPNPQKVKLQEQLQAQQQELQKEASLGIAANPKNAQFLQEMEKQIEALPDFISTVPIDKETHNHDAEASCCLDWINSPEGRRYRNGTAKERDAFANVRWHYLEHDKLAKAAKQTPPPPPRPISRSLNMKDLPPSGKSQLAAEGGLQVPPEDFAATTPPGTVQ
jgi:hypothetical protein